MDISIQNQDGLDATLHIQVAAADYEQALNAKIEDYRKKVTVPGFRKGKAPVGLVKKMIEKEAKHEIVDRLMQERIQQYMQENNVKLVLNPLSTYNAEDIDWSNEHFQFTYELGLRPEVKLDLKALNELTRYQVEISDEDVEKEIRQMQKQAGKVEPTEAVTNDDNMMVYLRFRELNEEGEAMEGGLEETKLITLKEAPEALSSLLIGKAKDSKQKVNIRDIYSNEEIAKTFGIDANMAKDLSDNFELELVNMFHHSDAELNQELFDKYFEPGKVSTEEEFREEWGKVIAGYFNQQADNALVQEMKKALLENTTLDLPEKLLAKYMLISYDAKDAAQIEDYDTKLKDFREELKWMVIADYIAEEQNITITEEDVLNYTLDMIHGEFARMGMGNLDDKTLRQYGINYLSKDNNYRRTELALRDGRIFEYLLSQVSPKQEPVDSKKFEQLRNKA